MPEVLHPGVLYVSEEFCIAIHLCPCGCGAKVRTPLGPKEWLLTESDGRPSLRPSIGNWQIPCQSHYWIDRGEIVWSNKWSHEAIEAGRRREERERRKHYDTLDRRRNGKLKRLWRSVRHVFSRKNQSGQD